MNTIGVPSVFVRVRGTRLALHLCNDECMHNPSARMYYCLYSLFTNIHVGTYRPQVTKMLTCAPCKKGYYQMKSGALDCDECPGGYYCPVSHKLQYHSCIADVVVSIKLGEMANKGCN